MVSTRSWHRQLSRRWAGVWGRLREVCGAVSAAFMLTGLKYPNPSPGDKAAKTRSYAVVQELAERFRRENGSIVCRELLGLGKGPDSPEPSDRTEAYYKRRPCPDYIEIAARIVGEKLNEDVVWNDLPYQVL